MKIGDERELVSTKVNHSGQFTIPDYLQDLESGKFGSVTKEIKDLIDRSMYLLKPKFAMYPDLLHKCYKSSINEDVDRLVSIPGSDIIQVEDNHEGMRAAPVVIIDSDEEEPEYQRPARLHQNIVLPMPTVGYPLLDSKVCYPFFKIRKMKSSNVESKSCMQG